LQQINDDDDDDDDVMSPDLRSRKGDLVFC